MTANAISQKYHISYTAFIGFLHHSNLNYTSGKLDDIVDDGLVESYVNMFKESEYYVPKIVEEEEKPIADDLQQNEEQFFSVPVNNNEKPYINNKDNSKPLSKVISVKELNCVLEIQAIKRMGIISFVCAFFNPLIGLIIGIIGKNRGNSMYDAPISLNRELSDALWYTKRGIALSLIFLVLYAIGVIISLIITLIQI